MLLSGGEGGSRLTPAVMGITLGVLRNGFDHQRKVRVSWWEAGEELT